MERALAARLPPADAVPARLHEAMRYSVLGGGKRVRPALVFATARTLGLDEDEVEAAACAIELMHVYSLVHDDLPAMDDDDLRRGRPTCHKAYDEATAILVGRCAAAAGVSAAGARPGAARVAGDPTAADRPAERRPAAPSAWPAARRSICEAQGRQLDIAQVEDMHARKTGAVIRASVLMAAECVPQLDAASVCRAESLRRRDRPGVSDSGRSARCARRRVDARQGDRRGPRARQAHPSGGDRHSGLAGAGSSAAQRSARCAAAVRRRAPHRCDRWLTGCCRGVIERRPGGIGPAVFTESRACAPSATAASTDKSRFP